MKRIPEETEELERIKKEVKFIYYHEGWKASLMRLVKYFGYTNTQNIVGVSSYIHPLVNNKLIPSDRLVGKITTNIEIWLNNGN